MPKLINIPHLASQAFGRPQYATPLIMDQVKALLIPRMRGEMQLAEDLSDVPQRQLEAGEESGYQVAGLAIIPVQGVLVSRRGTITQACTELNSYERIRSNIATALNDTKVKHIVLDINSGGGAATGCKELADYIYSVRDLKPVTAVINFNAYSAAYFLAAACGRVVISQTGGAGSIGVILEHMEISQYEASLGINITTFSRGEHKNDGSMHTPLSDSATAAINDMVDAAYQIFVESVARYRGLSLEAVMATEAGLYTGHAAVDVGLADELVKSPQDYINQLATECHLPIPPSRPRTQLKARVASL